MLLGRAVDPRYGIVIERAVADHANYRTFRIRRLYAQGGRKPCAQAADAAGKPRPCLDSIEITMKRQTVSYGLVHDHRIRRQNLTELVGDPTGVHRLLVRERARLVAASLSLAIIFPAKLLGALLTRRIARRNLLFERGQQALQRAFNFTRQAKIRLVAVVRYIVAQRIFIEKRYGRSSCWRNRSGMPGSDYGQ